MNTYEFKSVSIPDYVMIPKDETLTEEIRVDFEYTDGDEIRITDVLTELNEDQKESFRFWVKEMFSGRTVDFKQI